MDRLDKFLCDSGIGTRSQVKVILKAGRVTVDGKVERDNSRKIDPQVNVIALDGETLGGKRRIVLMLNKPAGFVTATEDAAERTVTELLPAEYKHFDLKPVGRLDKATEGLLLFTNDGDLLHRLISPKKGSAENLLCPPRRRSNCGRCGSFCQRPDIARRHGLSACQIGTAGSRRKPDHGL